MRQPTAFLTSTLVLLTATLFFPTLKQLQAKPTSNEIAATVKPTKIEDKTTVKFPESVDDVQIGGAGRYILFQFNSLKKIGVMDVNEAKITHYIETPDTSSKFAAGLNKLVLVNGEGNVISRYDLKTGKRELTSTIDLPSATSSVVMGNASDGPVIVTAKGGHSMTPYQVDVKTLKASKMVFEGNNGHGVGAGLRMSSNGKTIGNWSTSGSPSGLKSYVQMGSKWKSTYEHTSVGAIIPSPDGKILYTGRGIFTNQLKRLGELEQKKHDDPTVYSVPAVHGSFYLNVSAPSRFSRNRNSEKKPTEKVTLHMTGESRPLLELEELETIVSDDDQWGRKGMTLEKRLIFVPKANLIAQLSSTADSVVLTRFDVEQALEETDFEFLFVTSQPPLEIPAGSPLKYKIKSKSKIGGVKYTLDSGPTGMKVSSSGTVTWSPTESSAPENFVIVTVKDKSGQETFHTFNLKVIGGKGSAETSSNNATFSTARTGPPVVSPTTDGGKEKTIQLPGTISDMTVGGGGKFVLIHMRDLKKIGVFDVGKGEIVKYFPATDDQTLMVAGANHLLVVGGDQGVISRYNLTTLERELTKTVPFDGAIRHIGMGSNSFGPALVRWSSSSGALDRTNFAFIDLETLGESKKMTWIGNRGHSSYRDNNAIRVSSDGKVFSIAGMGPFKIRGNNVERISTSHDNRNVIPADNGKYFVSGNRILNSKLIPINPNQNRQQSYSSIIPSVTGPYYLSLTGSSNRGSSRGNTSKAGAKLFIFGDTRPIVNISDLPRPSPPAAMFFIPDAEVIVSASPTADALVLRRMDIEEALKESGVDYLIVTSAAPDFAKLGQLYTYKLDVKSKKGGVKYKLDSGPTGMEISADGTVSWSPSKGLKDAEQKVIVTVSDAAGQEVFHTFSIEIPEVVELIAAEKRSADEEKLRIATENNRKKILEREKVAAAQRQRLKEQMKKQMNSNSLAPVPLAIPGMSKLNPTASKEAVASSSNYPMRDWIDVTGKHRIRARFSHVKDKTNVVLTLENGEEKTVPLAKLSSQDIYRAVGNDLKKNGQLPPRAEADDNPFQNSAAKTNNGYVSDPQILTEVIDSVEQMIKTIQGEEDVKTIVDKVVHPELIAQLKRLKNYEQLLQTFRSGGDSRLLEGLTEIDFQKGKMKDGVISFTSKRGTRLKKDGNVWKVKG